MTAETIQLFHPRIELVPIVKIDAIQGSPVFDQQLDSVRLRWHTRSLEVVAQGPFDQLRQRLAVFSGTRLSSSN